MAFTDVKVLDREPGWFRRGVKEAIHIEVENSNLNRDRGRYTLPPVYRELLHSQPSRLTISCHGSVSDSEVMAPAQ